MKKKFFFTLIILGFSLSFIYGIDYKINEVTFNSIGVDEKSYVNKTKKYSLLESYPLDKNLVFNSEEEIEKYIKNYIAVLESTRLFETVECNYTIDSEDINIDLFVKDSHHLVIMPYPKISSNDGISLKLKAKDTNFLGSLHQMNTEINLKEIKKTDSGLDFKFGFNFSYNHPFKAGLFNAVWLNDYGLDYCKDSINLSDNPLEWNAQTGIELSRPINKILGLQLTFLQSSFRNRGYLIYNDDIYYRESFTIQTPLTLISLPNYTSISYSPSISLNFNWDINGINSENDSLSSPEVIFKHSIYNGKIVWIENMRKGYHLDITNSFSYNFQRSDLVPYLSFEANYFNFYENNEYDFWNRFGINSRLKVFHYFDVESNKYFYGNSIGDSLRGILDNNYFGNNKPYGTTSSCILLNIDLPHNVLTTDFSKEILNFNMQIAPFFDMALVYDRNSNRYFSFEDGYYCSGMEVLLFPKQWSSITVRASIGFDIKALLKEVNPIVALKKYDEIFIGIGLQY